VLQEFQFELRYQSSLTKVSCENPFFWKIIIINLPASILKSSPLPPGQFWIARNSWGMYWGDMGYFYVRMGSNQLGIESECAWAVPGEFTTHNTPCDEDGKGCIAKDDTPNDVQATQDVWV
jgi:hypothetical protein